MYLSISWVLLFFINIHETFGNKDVIDFVTLYRLPKNGYSLQAMKEYHRHTNAIGMLLKTPHYKYLDSVEGMVPLACSPATKECKWILSDGWGYTDISVNADIEFSFNITDLDNPQSNSSCDYKNMRCQGFCRVESGISVCRCPNEYTKRGATSCIYNSGGVTTVVTEPTSFNSMYDRRWLIVPPEHCSTHLNITVYGNGYPTITVREFQNVHTSRTIIQMNQGRRHVKTHYLLDVDYRRHHHNGTSIEIDFMRPHLTLNKDYGTLEYDVTPVADAICVSVIYTSPSNTGKIVLKTEVANRTNVEYPAYIQRQFGEWTMRRFTMSTPGLSQESVHLVLEVSGSGTTLHSIVGCSPFGDGDITVVKHKPTVPDLTDSTKVRKGSTTSEDIMKRCYHGGKYSTEAGMCICPAGFAGDRCQRGCGPNYFGNNCSAVCSDFSWGCSGIIFCKGGQPCLCSSGYTGQQCAQECSRGKYGANCTQECGSCNRGYCDVFTGHCGEGCSDGFHPPSCHIPYKYPANAPMILHQELNLVTVATNYQEVNGEGDSEFYQIQLREHMSYGYWREEAPRRIQSSMITANVTHLIPGISYDVKVIYFDRDGNSYQGHLVPETTFSTICTVPESHFYRLETNTTKSTIKISWQYSLRATDCPVTGYTIFLRRKWKTVEYNVSSTNSFIIQDLLSGVSYEVKIRANTNNGPAPISEPSFVTTSDGVPLGVVDLQVKQNGLGKLTVSWQPPPFSGGRIHEYSVLYWCVKFLACSEICSDSAEVRVGANEYYTELSGLKHHAQYSIKVAAKTEDLGPYFRVHGVTKDTTPNIAPGMSINPVLSTTNTSITVQWLPIEDCTLFNGYMVGYHYEVFTQDHRLVQKGDTTNTNATVNELKPQTKYLVYVYTESSGGWNVNEHLIINVSTATTVPEKVQNLTVYERGRRTIGLRWTLPTNTYGEIKYFSVSLCEINNCLEKIVVDILPSPCVAWPQFYCHTINNLIPHRKYSISIRARNVNVNEYGDAAVITAITSEGAPDASLDLTVVSQTTDSISFEWKPPRMFNGILRSFLINVEQIDAANTTNCCTYFPLQEVPIKNVQEIYTSEVTNLSPASKYVIGISAKTISLGPVTQVTTSTSPEIPKYFASLQLTDNTVTIQPVGEFLPGISSTYLLLVLLDNENSTSRIWNLQIADKLKTIVNSSFYIVEEYTKEDLPLEVEIGGDIEPHNGTIGILQDPDLPDSFYVGVALVLDYYGAVNVGFEPSESEK